MPRESIEALLNPSLKVSRPVAACARCRTAKIKCDGKLPACTGCERAGKTVECSNANDDFAKGKERSYVAALETAIARMQKRIDEIKSGQSDSRTDSAMMFGLGQSAVKQKTITNTRRKEASNIDELVGSFGVLTVNATSRDFHGVSATMSFAKLVLAISMKGTLPLFSDSPLPPHHETLPLVNHYFEDLYVRLPFFSETKFMNSLIRVRQEQEQQMKMASTYDIWSVRMVLAISAASMSRTKGDQYDVLALKHTGQAMGYIEHVVYPGSIQGLQALLFLVQYSLVDPQYFDCWYLCGFASRLMVDIGLHCEPEPEASITKQDLDMRRRVFYSTFALDRRISIAFSQPVSFTDDSAPNVQLPVLATAQEGVPPSALFLRSIQASLYLFDVRRVQSAFYQKTRWSARLIWDVLEVRNYVQSTLSDLTAWYTSIPENLPLHHRQLLNLEYLYSQVLFLAPNKVVVTQHILNDSKIRLFDMAMKFGESLRWLIENATTKTYLDYVDFCRARYVSRMWLDMMWSDGDLLLQSAQSLQQCGFTSSKEATERAIAFLDTMNFIHTYPVTRWGNYTLLEIYQETSAVLYSRLRAKASELMADTLNHRSRNIELASKPLVYCPDETDSGSPSTEYARVHPSQTQNTNTTEQEAGMVRKSGDPSESAHIPSFSGMTTWPGQRLEQNKLQAMSSRARRIYEWGSENR